MTVSYLVYDLAPSIVDNVASNHYRERISETMPDKFDTYREALIMETETEWPEEFDHIDDGTKSKLAERLHGDPESAANLEYVRTHTGFCRRIKVTVEDVQRVQDA